MSVVMCKILFFGLGLCTQLEISMGKISSPGELKLPTMCEKSLFNTINKFVTNFRKILQLHFLMIQCRTFSKLPLHVIY